MDMKTGRIYDSQDEALEAGAALSELMEIKESEMTAKQKQTRQVSTKDVRSVLGVRLCKARNKPCACGSGKKFKKCCLGRMRSADFKKQND